MAVYAFIPPARRSLRHDPSGRRFSLFGRVARTGGTAVVRKRDNSWEEFDVLPGTLNPTNRFTFGARGFAGTAPDGWDWPLRLYMGGHRYVIDETLRTELLAAVTAQEPAGYGAYISATTDPYTGDDIIASGVYAQMGVS